ncbi:MAG: sterol desaturase family protein [Myxococcota bacterium]|nr:sterol desaturase family protein [Myxococcota bacterium]
MIECLFLGLGVFAWTFIEYAMHNWVGHKLRGKVHFSREHLIHHRQRNYFTPLQKKLPFTGIVGFGIYSGSVAVLGMGAGSYFGLGVIAGYSVYEYIHWSNHMRAPRTAYGRWARRHHFSHHFTDARYNHGVTSPLWDLVFGTYRAPTKIQVPAKFSMPWLVDSQTGRVCHQFGDDFELKGIRRSC